MKPLPQNSIPEDFPCFKSGVIYVIIDPKRSNYQYRLHKAVLSRISPVLSKALRLPSPKEAMEKLKIASTDAHTRFELIYSHKLGKWVLQRVVSLIFNCAEQLLLNLPLTNPSHLLHGDNLWLV